MATAIPDLTAALLLRIRSFTAVTALCPAARIRPEWPRKANGDVDIVVPPYQYFVLIQTGRGGPGEQPGARMQERVDIACYGPDARTAMLLWRTLHYHLCPPLGSGRQNSFTLGGCTVNTVQQEGGPNRLVDPDTAWPHVVGSYVVDYNQE